MLAPLAVDLLISCTLILLVGWAYDLIANWTGGSRQMPCCTATSAIGVGNRVDAGRRFLLSEPEGAGYTQQVKTHQRHGYTRHPA